MRTRWSEARNHYESLAVSLRAVLACYETEHTYAELISVLGLGGATVAVETEPLGTWCMAARDAALLQTAKRYGLQLRELHPPEAADGLGSSDEFSLHFQDSYVPLIERALDNNQFVLAWCGWPAPRERLWGVLTEYTGQSLTGFTLWHDGKPLPLTGPAYQVYIVEDYSAPTEERFTLTARFTHAALQFCAMWENRWATGDGVITGAAAYEAWQAVLTSPTRPAGATPIHKQHAQAVRVHAAARSYLASWLRSIAGGLAGENVALAAHWAAQCDEVSEMLASFETDEAVEKAFSKAKGVASILESLQRAAAAEADVHEKLKSVP